MRIDRVLVAAALGAVALVLAGWFIGHGFARARTADRYVTVRQANRGVSQILPRDQAPGSSEEGQLYKTIRVVSTVEYYLE